jgi:hypothetical protein
MKKVLNTVLVSSLAFILWGCPNGFNKHKYTKAYFPAKATNLDIINSEFDDYNSVLPETHFGKRLVFSSNRQTSGENFNIIGEDFHAAWYWDDGNLVVDKYGNWQNTDFILSLLSDVDKNGNQFGPYMIGKDTVIGDTYKRYNFFTFSTNADGDLYHQEYFYNLSDDLNTAGENSEHFTIKFLDDSHQQRYVSFFGTGISTIDAWNIDTKLFTDIYFDESNGTSHDIFSIHKPDTLDFNSFLKSDIDYIKNLQEALSSSSDDRCPYVNGNFIVFTSNREGGYGGYDLYYSYYYNGNWQEPINFGPGINTEYDEFRPVSVQVMNFANDLMIFSSNRHGGMGGFDLYYVGIEKINPILYIEK